MTIKEEMNDRRGWPENEEPASQFKQSSPEGEGTLTVDDLREAFIAGYRRMGWEEGITWATSPKNKEEPEFDEWLSRRSSPPKSEQPQERHP